MRSGLRAVASEAFACGLKAKCGTLTVLDVEQLRSLAEQLLDADDPFRAEVIGFAVAHEMQRRDPAAMIGLGDALCTAVTAALRPEPVGLERSDIHG